MPGGLLNIISVGNANLFLTGNPSKTFFKVTYSKYTNFGLQKFRMDFDGSTLRATVPAVFLPKVGTPLWLTIRRDRCFVFDA